MPAWLNVAVVFSAAALAFGLKAGAFAPLGSVAADHVYLAVEGSALPNWSNPWAESVSVVPPVTPLAAGVIVTLVAVGETVTDAAPLTVWPLPSLIVAVKP